jgi:hypothetical protein
MKISAYISRCDVHRILYLQDSCPKCNLEKPNPPEFNHLPIGLHGGLFSSHFHDIKFDVYKIAIKWLYENVEYVYHVPLSDDDLVILGFCNGYEAAQQSRALDAANVCRTINHFYVDGLCSRCGSKEPPRK